MISTLEVCLLRELVEHPGEVPSAQQIFTSLDNLLDPLHFPIVCLLIIDLPGGILARHDPLSCCEETGVPHTPAAAHGSRASCPTPRQRPSFSPRELGQRDARAAATRPGRRRRHRRPRRRPPRRPVRTAPSPASPPSSSSSWPDGAVAVVAAVCACATGQVCLRTRAQRPSSRRITGPSATAGVRARLLPHCTTNPWGV